MDKQLPWRQWLPEFVLLAAMWGSSFLFMREGVQAFGPFATAWVRVTIAALALMPFLIWRKQTGTMVHRWRPILLMGLLSSGIPAACYSFALLFISTGLSSILNSTTPLFGALIAWWWLGDRLNAWRVLGLVFGFAGVVLLTLNGSDVSALTYGDEELAIAACLLATLCYGVAGSFIKKYLFDVPVMVTTTGSLFGASIGLLLPAVWFWPSEPPSLQAWLSLLILGLFCTALAYVMYFRLMTRNGPATAMTVTYLIPVFANCIGVVWLDEIVTPWMLGCAVLIVFGTALASGLISPFKPKED